MECENFISLIVSFGECNENFYLVNERQQLCFRKKKKQKRCLSSLVAPQYKKTGVLLPNLRDLSDVD